MVGPNAVRSHRVHALSVLASQLRTPLPASPCRPRSPPRPVAAVTPLAELSCCALMGTVVRAGSGAGVVVATDGDAEFGRIAVGLGSSSRDRVPGRAAEVLDAARQVAGALTGAIFVINVALHKPVIDALLFSLAIAVGISPQLLPAVVSTSLAAGSRQLAQRKVLVKRLVCIEDLGDIDVLFTDKTGTLAEGSLHFMRSAGPDGRPMTSRCCWGCCATRR